jgi:hypothetical protein
MSKDHDSWATNDGNHVMVPNFSEMISIVTLVTGARHAQVLEPRGVDERLDPQHVRLNARCISHNHFC